MAVFDDISGVQDKISGVQVCRLILQESQVCKCADLADKYIGNIFPRQANSFEHVDVLCGLHGNNFVQSATVWRCKYHSDNLGLQIFKNFLTRCQPWWHLVRFSPTPKCAWEFSRKFLECAPAKLCRLQSGFRPVLLCRTVLYWVSQKIPKALK